MLKQDGIVIWKIKLNDLTQGLSLCSTSKYALTIAEKARLIYFVKILDALVMLLDVHFKINKTF